MSIEIKSIIVGGITGELALAPDADAVKEAALKKAEGLQHVKTDQDLEVFVEARRGIHDILKGVAKTYEVFNRPILDAGKKLRELRDGYIGALEKREKELDGAINWYQREQLRLAQEAQRAAEEAQRKAQAEQARIAAELEAARRREQEAIAAAEKAKTDAARAKAEAEAAKARQAQQDAEAKAFAAELAAEPITAPVETTAPKGVSARVSKDYRIIGNNDFEKRKSLIALAQKYPFLVNLEIRRADVLSMLNNQGVTELPGLEITEEVRTSIR